MEDSGYGTLEPAITPKNLRELCENDLVLLKCYEQMTTYCTRYAHDVFSMMSEQNKLSIAREENKDTPEMYEELRVIDRNRHNLHEAMIASVILVSRELAKRKLDNEWMRDIVASGRAGYATFAMLTFFNLHATIK
jgi:hypothetical protein